MHAPLPVREVLEIVAFHCLMNGQGLRKVGGVEWADNAYVGFPLHNPHGPVVFFRRGDHTVALVEFRVVPVPEAEQTDFAVVGMEP